MLPPTLVKEVRVSDFYPCTLVRRARLDIHLSMLVRRARLDIYLSMLVRRARLDIYLSMLVRRARLDIYLSTLVKKERLDTHLYMLERRVQRERSCCFGTLQCMPVKRDRVAGSEYEVDLCDGEPEWGDNLEN
jgi:hypothetical protein